MWHIYNVEFNLSVRKIKSRNFQDGTRKYHTDKAIQTQKDKCSFLFEDPSAKSLDVNIEPN